MTKKEGEEEGKAGEGAGVPAIDAFGEERDPKTGEQIAPKVETKKEEGKVEDKGEDKGKVEDLEKNPVVLSLRKEIKDMEGKLSKSDGDKVSMGKNLSEMRKKLDKLEKGEKGAAAIEPVYKEIKRVKDLSKDEQEAMTDTEKRLWDESADFKQRINEMVAGTAKEKEAAETQAEKDAEELEAHEAFVQKAQGIALQVAGNDTDMANKILKEFNDFANNETLDDAGIESRMKKAATLVPDYKAPKEQNNRASKGSTAPKESDNKDDPFGVQEIVDTVQRGKRGGYQL